jgi:drug/metabolite transporter (DMT)-like permease
MFNLSTSFKVVFFGVFLIIIQTFFGASFDTTTKFLSSSDLLWYHYYLIGNGFSLTISLIYVFFSGTIKKHILFENKKDYFLPLVRGITFTPIPIIIYYTLEKIPLSVFTPILMTTPFFIYLWSVIFQKEKINIKYWIILLFGFSGTLLVAKPSFFQSNPFIILIFFVAAYNALTHVIVSKYSSRATTYGYTFYNLLPLTLVSFILFIFDPIYLSYREIIFIFIGGGFLFLAAFFLTLIFQIAGKYSRILSPFFFIQLVWASLFGIVFFNESIDSLSIAGIIIIIFSGTLTIINTPKVEKL